MDMPAAIAHYLHGEKIWSELEKTGRVQKEKLIKDAFDWGKQGPDFLFCHRFFPWQKGESLQELGNRLHEEPPENTLRVLQQLWREQPGAAARSYILGFLCHYSLDRTCHPYIEFLSREMLEADPSQTEGIFHNEIESALDGILFRWETRNLVTEFRLPKTLPKNQEVQEAIASLYDALLRELWGLPGKGHQVLQAEKDARLVFRALDDRTSLKKQLMEKIEKKGRRNISCHLRGMLEGGDWDYANVNHASWNDREGAAHTEDFFQLFDQAVEDAWFLVEHFPDEEPEALAQGKFF